MKHLKKLIELSPEKNLKTRAVYYVVGTFGIVHLVVLLIVAIVRNDPNYFNPLATIDIQKLWPASQSSVAIYVFGWLGFGCLILIVYRFLVRNRD